MTEKEEVHTNKTICKIYYANQMSPNYKTEERIIKDVINNNIITRASDKHVNITIFYKNQKTRNLIMRNQLYRNNNKLQYYLCFHV